MEDRRCFE